MICQLVLAVVIFAAAGVAAPWCETACAPFGGVDVYLPAQVDKDRASMFCRDGAFFDGDRVEKCDPHGGVAHRARHPGALHGEDCSCKDGALMEKPEP